jgi:hypothetical protein
VDPRDVPAGFYTVNRGDADANTIVVVEEADDDRVSNDRPGDDDEAAWRRHATSLLANEGRGAVLYDVYDQNNANPLVVATAANNNPNEASLSSDELDEDDVEAFVIPADVPADVLVEALEAVGAVSEETGHGVRVFGIRDRTTLAKLSARLRAYKEETHAAAATQPVGVADANHVDDASQSEHAVASAVTSEQLSTADLHQPGLIKQALDLLRAGLNSVLPTRSITQPNVTATSVEPVRATANAASTAAVSETDTGAVAIPPPQPSTASTALPMAALDQAANSALVADGTMEKNPASLTATNTLGLGRVITPHLPPAVKGAAAAETARAARLAEEKAALQAAEAQEAADRALLQALASGSISPSHLPPGKLKQLALRYLHAIYGQKLPTNQQPKDTSAPSLVPGKPQSSVPSDAGGAADPGDKAWRRATAAWNKKVSRQAENALAQEALLFAHGLAAARGPETASTGMTSGNGTAGLPPPAFVALSRIGFDPAPVPFVVDESEADATAREAAADAFLNSLSGAATSNSSAALQTGSGSESDEAPHRKR